MGTAQTCRPCVKNKKIPLRLIAAGDCFWASELALAGFTRFFSGLEYCVGGIAEVVLRNVHRLFHGFLAGLIHCAG